jgi:hypothetical protein
MNAPALAIATEQYEALRRHIVEGPARLGVDPLGAILVVKAGVAGWMRQWTRTSRATLTPATLPASLPSSEPIWQHELTMLLAGITACHLRPPLSS